MSENVKCSEIFIPGEVINRWQKIVNLLADLLHVPVCLIMRLLDPDIEVYVGNQSPTNPFHNGAKERIWNSGLYCEAVIKSRKPLQVIDAKKDARWCQNPDIVYGMVAYYGLPIIMPDGAVFGTMCVLDDHPREFTSLEKELLFNFRDVLQEHLDLYYINYVLGEKNKQLRDYLHELKSFRNMSLLCPVCLTVETPTGERIPLREYTTRFPEAMFRPGPVCSSCLSPRKEQ